MTVSGVLTDAAHKAGAKGLVGLYGTKAIENRVSYFVVGEGGYTTQNKINELAATGTGLASNFTFTLANVPLLRGNLSVIAGTVIAIDDGQGHLSGAGVTGTIKYKSGLVTLTYTVPPGLGIPLQASYTFKSGAKTPNASQVILEAQGSPILVTNTGHQAFYAKNIPTAPVTPDLCWVEYAEPPAVPSPRAIVHCWLNTFEFIDDGLGESPAIFEIGVFDTEDTLLSYATMYPPVIKSSIVMNRDCTFIW